MFTAALLLTATVVLSPNPDAVKPVSRPLCMMNIGANNIVYAGDVKEVKLSDDKSTVLIRSTGGKLNTVSVPANQAPEAFTILVASSIRNE